MLKNIRLANGMTDEEDKLMEECIESSVYVRSRLRPL